MNSKIISLLLILLPIYFITGCKQDTSALEKVSYIDEKSEYAILDGDEIIFMPSIALVNNSNDPVDFYIRIEFKNQEIKDKIGAIEFGKEINLKPTLFTLKSKEEYSFGETVKVPSTISSQAIEELRFITITLYNDSGDSRIIYTNDGK